MVAVEALRVLYFSHWVLYSWLPACSQHGAVKRWLTICSYHAPMDENDVKTGHEDIDSERPEATVDRCTFGGRLKEERLRLNLSQLDLAKVGCVGRTTQHIYETDQRGPDVAYLYRVREVGIDIAYLLLGVRTAPTNPNSLHTTPTTLANAYRIVDEFCVDSSGNRMPLETRERFFLFLCVSMKDDCRMDASLDALRTELQRIKVGSPAVSSTRD